ncbi:hypothetical protein BU24DRAFT_289093 [Aaosphaeria arxii CBS 175.79]|uniref:Uncharacterized protein n=1 Tax=Aaosphaeria arxii CBS 175.79 TaxID=1450172 RepID=A0A6A5XG04_9PLEO|nr:uncharacterized protein BU24DRAFT_289093 [Aaosphaeria arxii CBS 175.79]KAF2011789.1 hypothetical protein BU24DRAFT_289093 [Aaosphaeria arxii CBS 175.79]
MRALRWNRWSVYHYPTPNLLDINKVEGDWYFVSYGVMRRESPFPCVNDHIRMKTNQTEYAHETGASSMSLCYGNWIHYRTRSGTISA